MIILTGGAGFIGSCFLAKLNENNINDVLVVDQLATTDKWKNLANKKFTGFLHKDKFRKFILDTENTVLNYSSNEFDNKKIDAIVHLGACSTTTEKDADYLMDNNFLYSKELANFAIKKNIRFIYASSAATYGDGKQNYSDKSISNLIPLNCYGLSKHLFDMWIVENSLESKVTGLKFFNVFGPNELHKGDMQSMVSKAFKQIEETGKIKLFKSYNKEYAHGEQMRDFIYVKDSVEIMMRILNDKTFTGIYNVGTGLARSWNDLANAAFAAMERIPNIEYVEMPEELKKQYQYFTEADTEKLMSKLGSDWKFTSLEEAVKDYIQNYLKEGKIW